MYITGDDTNLVHLENARVSDLLSSVRGPARENICMIFSFAREKLHAVEHVRGLFKINIQDQFITFQLICFNKIGWTALVKE